MPKVIYDYILDKEMFHRHSLTDLSNFPSSFSGQANKFVTVNDDETGVDFSEGTGGVTDHSLLNNLNWANAGHTIDTEFEVGAYDVLLSEISTPANPSANGLKVYAKDVGGVTKLHTLDSDGTESVMGEGGGGATDLPDLTDVDDALEYTSGFVLQADGDKYTGAQLSHTLLGDIGSNTHAEIDAHIADSSIHTEDNLLVHISGNETINDVKTFDEFPILPSENPTTDYQPIHKLYFDTFVTTGARFVDDLKAATSEALAANTYDNGTLGVGATITADENGALSLNLVELSEDDEILVKDEATASHNGAYVITQIGDAGNPFILTRITKYDQQAEVIGGTFFSVLEGEYKLTQWSMTTTGDITMGTTDIVFGQLSKAIEYTGIEGIDVSGTEISLNYDVMFDVGGNGLTLAGGVLGYEYGGTGLTSLGSANEILGVNAGATAYEHKTLAAGSNVAIVHTEGQIEISSSLSGAPDYTYADYTLHSHPASSFTWTNLPLALTAGSSYLRIKVNLTGAVEYRIKCNQATAGFAGSKFRLRYSTNNSTFLDIGNESNVGDLDVGTGTRVKVGTPEDIVSGAKQDVWLQIYAYGGDGVVDPAWRQIEIEIKYNSSIVDGSASDVVYKTEVIHAHPTSNTVWTNMPAALTEFIASALTSRRKVDLRNVTHYRIICNQGVAGFAGSDLNLQYSLNGSTFAAADTANAGELDVGTGTGAKQGAWAALADGAKTDVWIRLVGKDGDGIVDPGWRYLAIQFKEYTFGQGVAGSDTCVLFNDEGSTGYDLAFTYNKTTDLLTVPNADITALANLTDNGFIKTSGGDGTLSVDTNTYLTEVTAHDLLSTTHGDTTASAVARGDIIVGTGATPKWDNLALGSTGQILYSDNTDLKYGDHGNIAGLTDDDHTQYILVDGTRAFTGNQSFGDFNITNVGDIGLDSLTADDTNITMNSPVFFAGDAGANWDINDYTTTAMSGDIDIAFDTNTIGQDLIDWDEKYLPNILLEYEAIGGEFTTYDINIDVDATNVGILSIASINHTLFDIDYTYTWSLGQGLVTTFPTTFDVNFDASMSTGYFARWKLATEDKFYVTGDGNTYVAGTLEVIGHPILEGVTATGATGTGKLVFDTSPTLATPNIGVASGTSLAATGLIKSSSSSAGIGYATGAGGAVTQGAGSGKATAVTLNNVCGQITTNNAALASYAVVTFTVNNTSVATTDTIALSQDSGGTAGAYGFWVSAVGAGSFSISIMNVTGGSLSQAIVMNFVVIKSVAA
jgi:hypothetical protein